MYIYIMCVFIYVNMYMYLCMFACIVKPDDIFISNGASDAIQKVLHPSLLLSVQRVR